MALPDEFAFDPEQFRGTARLFPLPNLVLFPHVMQPLHIFEPRYRQMLEAALGDDGLLAMATLAPGWESDYEGRPPLHRHACLCRVVTHHRRDDGTYNILIVGLRRIVLGEELSPENLFREAKVEILEDTYSPGGLSSRARLQRKLVSAFKAVLPRVGEAYEQLDQLLSSELALGMLCDIVAFTLELEIETKLELLAETDVDRRAKRLVDHLAKSGTRTGSKEFPPDFSVN